MSMEQKTLTEALSKPLTLKGHTSGVSSVSLTSDGKLGLSGSYDKTLRLWDLSTASCIRELRGHTASIRSVALSADGKCAISGGDDEILRVWNLVMGSCERELSGHAGIICSIALSADGERAISGGNDKIVRVWNIAKGSCERELMGHIQKVCGVALNNDGYRAISTCDDSALRVWNLKTGICEQVFENCLYQSRCVALSIDGNYAIVGGNNRIPDTTLLNDRVRRSLDIVGRLRFLNLRTGLYEQDLHHSNTLVCSVAIAVDGIYAVSVGDSAVSKKYDTTLRVWNLNSGTCAKELIYQQEIFSVVLCQFNSHLYALTGLSNGTLDFRLIHTYPTPKELFPEKFPISLHPPLPKFETKAERDTDEIAKLKKRVHQLELEYTSKSAPSGASSAAIAGATSTNRKSNEELRFSVSYQLNYKDLTIGKEIGRGGFGIVYQGSWKYSPTPVAIKQLLSSNLSADATQEFLTEVQVMANLSAPNVVHLYGYCANPYCIVMEYMQQGSLYHILRNEKPLEWTLRIRFAEDITRGLAFLHSKNILHRDIKSMNVLIDDRSNAKLSDFGLAKVKSEQSTSSASKGVAGTIAWMAPELAVSDDGCTRASDIYSLGITLWELASRELPFKKVPKPALIPTRVMGGEKDPIPADCPKNLASAIEACRAVDPKARPDADTLVAFFQSKSDNLITFLQGYLASKQSSNVSFRQAVAGNLASANAGAAGASAADPSFNRALAGNLASGKW